MKVTAKSEESPSQEEPRIVRLLERWDRLNRRAILKVLREIFFAVIIGMGASVLIYGLIALMGKLL